MQSHTMLCIFVCTACMLAIKANDNISFEEILMGSDPNASSTPSKINKSSSDGIHLIKIDFHHVQQPFVLSSVCLVGAICKIGFHYAHFLSSRVPESCLLILIGIISGLILYVLQISDDFRALFVPDRFFIFLLPPIVLDSAYSLYARAFLDNLGTVLLFAVMGTILACLFIAFFLYYLFLEGYLGQIVDLNLVRIFIFSAIIVAVDPVAVLAVFSEVGVNEGLYFVIFGESLLNDGVTVVLYKVMQAYNLMDLVDSYQIFMGITKFFVVCLGGSFIGILTGVLSALFTRCTVGISAVQPIILIMTAYLGYLLSEMFQLSGIISVVFCGLLQVHYSFGNITYKSEITVRHLTHVLASMSEIMIFMFLGLEVVDTKHSWNIGFIIWSIIFCTISRFLCCFGMSMLINFFDRSRIQLIGYTEMFMISFGGLRGAVAFSLAALLHEEDLPMKQMFVTTTLFIVMFTVFAQGCTIKPLVHFLQINLMTEKTDTLFLEINSHVADHLLAGMEAIMGLHGTNRLRETLNALDFKYIRKYMMNNPQDEDTQIMDVYNKIVVRDTYTKTEDGESPKDSLRRRVSGDQIQKTAADSDIRLRQSMKSINDLASLRSALISGRPSQIVRGSDNIPYRRNSVFARLKPTSHSVKPSFARLEDHISIYEEEEEPTSLHFFSSILQAVKKTIAIPEEEEGSQENKFVSIEVQTDLILLDFSMIDLSEDFWYRDEYWQGVLEPSKDMQKSLGKMPLESEMDDTSKINKLAVKSLAEFAPTTELYGIPVATEAGYLKSETATKDIQGAVDDIQGSRKFSLQRAEAKTDVFPSVLSADERLAGVLAKKPESPLSPPLIAENVPKSPQKEVLPETQTQGLPSVQSQQVYEKQPTNKPSEESKKKEVETAFKKLETQQSGSEKNLAPQEYVSVLIPERTQATSKEALPLEAEKEKIGMLLDAEKVDQGKLPASNEQAPKPPSEIAHSSKLAYSAELEVTAAPSLNVKALKPFQKEQSMIDTPKMAEDDAATKEDLMSREMMKAAEGETSTGKSSSKTNVLGWLINKVPRKLVNQQSSEPPIMDTSQPLEPTTASKPDPGPELMAAPPPPQRVELEQEPIVPNQETSAGKSANKTNVFGWLINKVPKKLVNQQSSEPPALDSSQPPEPTTTSKPGPGPEPTAAPPPARVELEQEAIVPNQGLPDVLPGSEVQVLQPESNDQSCLKPAQKENTGFLGTLLGQTVPWSDSKLSLLSDESAKNKKNDNKDKPKNE